MPDLGTFLSIDVFDMNPKNARDIATWLFTFSSGTMPAVGRNVTVPAGSPPTGTVADEQLFATLVSFGNLANPARHCELTASIVSTGATPVLHTWYLNGTSGLEGLWTTDVAGQPQITTTVLRRALMVPEAAIDRFDGISGTIWTIEDRQLHRSRVTFGKRSLDGRVELAAGLREGAAVPASVSTDFREGRSVRVTQGQAQ